tara:strand:- start:229 stop:657 length:429 start_codon:yes stop_codon:yes gene_type:complete
MAHFEIYEGSTSTSTLYADSLNQLVGENGNFRPSSKKNFLNPDKAVALTATKADGTSAIIVCSKEISSLLRSKELKFSELGSIQVFEFETEDMDEPMLLLNYPQEEGNSDIPKVIVTKDSLKAKSKPAKRKSTFDWTKEMAY